MSEPSLHIFIMSKFSCFNMGKKCDLLNIWTHAVSGADIMMQLDDVVDATHRKAIHTAQ
jgi:hypothetical protein